MSGSHAGEEREPPREGAPGESSWKTKARPPGQPGPRCTHSCPFHCVGLSPQLYSSEVTDLSPPHLPHSPPLPDLSPFIPLGWDPGTLAHCVMCSEETWDRPWGTAPLQAPFLPAPLQSQPAAPGDLSGGCGPRAQPGRGWDIRRCQERQRARTVGEDGEAALLGVPLREVTGDR